jgi:pilus assembly protein CpaF
MKLSDRLAQLAEEEEPGSRPPLVTEKKPPKKKTVAPRAKQAKAAAPGPDAGARKLTIDHHRATLEGIKAQVRSAVVKELGPRLAAGNVGEADLRVRLEHHLGEAMRSSSVSVSPRERAEFYNTMLADMLGWGPLEDLMADTSITEVMCNAHDDIWVERGGKLARTEVKFGSAAAYRQVIDRMLAIAGRRVDEASPMADGRLHDGSRINAIIPPLVVGEPVLTIRRFPETAFTVADLIRMESVSKDAAVFLEAAVRGKLNVLVSGGTGTGKTTLLNVLSNFIPDDERVITIEDAAELRLGQPHVVRLEGRPANIEGAGRVAIRDLVRNALRMRPDRIVVGEVRGAEAVDMLQAMNTGHEGSLTTVHANTARDALARIETMVLFAGLDLPLRAVREQIASALDIVVQLQRRPDGRRVIDRIAEVQGREGDTVTMQDVFTRDGDGPLRATGLRPHCAEKLKERGVLVAASIYRGPAAALGGR